MAGFRARVLHIADSADAERELRDIRVDPAGIALMAGKMQTRCIRVNGLQCRQANILKQELLSLGGDAAVARGTVACSIEATDVILIGTAKQLHRLCSKLAGQPFGLPRLGSELAGLLVRTATPPKTWNIAGRELTLERPLIMGILNVTPDSFSDGNRYLDPVRAADRAMEMAAAGADIIDIGGESTRPGAHPVPADEEARRVIPVIRRLAASSFPCPVSIDTWKSEIAAAAVAEGASIINDISGFTFDAAMADTAARTGAGVVLMHTRGTPGTMHEHTGYEDLVGEIIDRLDESVDRAVAAGIERSRIAIDPGICFAKKGRQNLEILRRLREFTSLGLPVLTGTSRKSFIGTALNRDAGERVYGTAATVAVSVANGASILRVHDVREMRDVADMTHAILTQA